MPTDPFDAFRQRLPDYVREVQQANSEASKALSFLLLVRQTFGGIEAEKLSRLVPELERFVSVRAGSVIIRGRIDALLGNLVIEFKMTLDSGSLDEAKTQLQKYVAALWAIEGRRRNYMLMAADGLRFRVYKPTAPLTTTESSPDEVSLEEVNILDIEAVNPEDSFRWLDRYVLWRVRIPPTTEDMAQHFGLDSPAFVAAMEVLRAAWTAGRGAATAPFQEWSKYLSVVYGSAVGDEALFLKHTYLATLAKLMVYTYYSSGAIPSKEAILKVLSGEAFKEWGIENFLEEDFFSWLVRGDAEDHGLRLAWELLKILERYDLSQLTEDVFKGLYQSLVDPETRHDLGEYYTPDWLAEWIVDRLFDDPTKTALDPACGSATFLVAAIRKKTKSIRMEPHLLLTHVLASVKGIDVHPLAVLVSKANYLMAIGDLVKFKAGRIQVPVYLANSIAFPTAKRDVEHGVEVYRYPVSDQASLVIPKEAVDKEIVAQLIEAATRFARMVSQDVVRAEQGLFEALVSNEVPSYPDLDQGAKDAVWSSCQTLAKLIKAKRDTIYSFIVKNVFRPATLGRFDIVMGNPPWLSYRYVRLPDYQQELKRMILRDHRLLAPKKTELLTHMELATLFFARCSMNYLRDGGRIGFVMPRAIFTADQHDAFRRGDFLPRTGFVEVIDLEGVSPLFNVPTSVVIAEKAANPGPPSSALRMRGVLPTKNARLEGMKELEAQGKFKTSRADIELVETGDRSAWSYHGEGPCGNRKLRVGPSPYMPKFREGATIVPRSMWWVDVRASQKFGVNPEEPFVETAKRSIEVAKSAYQKLRMSGNVERQYLYGGLLGSDVLPFVHLPVRPVVLPIEPHGTEYRMLKRDEIEARGHQGMARWLAKAEKEWNRLRGEKATKFGLYAWLDWAGKLTHQNPIAKFRVLYNASGTYLSACVVDASHPLQVNANGQVIHLRGYVSESKTIYYSTDNADEAHYLEAVFNSRVVDAIIKPLQSRGLWGERDIMKKALEVGIPQFDPRSPAHAELIALARDSSGVARGVLEAFVREKGGDVSGLLPQVVGQLRSKIRVAVGDRLDRIDALVCEILTETEA